MIAAANLAPSFADRRRLTPEELRRIDQPCVIREHSGADSDGVDFWVYTVGGFLDGLPLPEGCTVGGEVIVISGVDSRDEADLMAGLGLEDTINALNVEQDKWLDAQVALSRLQSVGKLDRLDMATKPDADKSDAFIADVAAIRPLIGDDVMLTVGGQDAPH